MRIHAASGETEPRQAGRMVGTSARNLDVRSADRSDVFLNRRSVLLPAELRGGAGKADVWSYSASRVLKKKASSSQLPSQA